ncbi:uncharacterized protein LOC126682119 [Mercurialis annua]|uniref:uncharacterized protein LOC126682119 n=1 Tax=Mercurialis annua TaxID=3986 RepID=UPI00215EBCAD|nr:uncharacterized protein LOC126682119 [Mercurialis annua]
MMATTIPAHFIWNPSYLPHSQLTSNLRPISRKPIYSSTHFHISTKNPIFNLKSSSLLKVLARVSAENTGGSGGGGAAPQQEYSKIDETKPSSSGLGDNYVGLFVRMLGLDNDPLDREQAVEALWKYSLGGKNCVDNIMQFGGCVNLIVNLLKSDSDSTSKAAAGLLRSIASVNVYRDVVAESGAIEEITGLLLQSSLTSEVKEQSICALWNLSVDENIRVKIANDDILPFLVKSLEDEDIRVKEAAGGVLANLALTHSNHNIMVEAGLIPKLAVFIKAEIEDDYKVIRKEARNALVELSKNEYYRILIVEEGLVPVPLIGAAAYKSYTPALHSWPSLPDGMNVERSYKGPSRFGASDLLLGLNVDDKNANIEDAKMKAIIGRSKQQFLARSGSIEVEDAKSSQTEISPKRQFTLLPWMDGVARLVLILELDDESALSRAANAIADASINEEMRNSFKEAGAIKHLVRLLYHKNDDIRLAAIGALERLSASNGVCQIIEAEGVLCPLIDIFKNSNSSKMMMEKTLNLLEQILDPSKEIKSKFYDGPVNGFKSRLDKERAADSSGGLTTSEEKISTHTRQNLLDSSVIARLVEMLKDPSLDIQRKAATILEFAATNDKNTDVLISGNIESGLSAVFQQNVLSELDHDSENYQPELYALQVEEAGQAISAASRLLTKLLDSDQFSRTINSAHFTELLRKTLKADIPLHYKDWVAACLVKLSTKHGCRLEFEDPINMEITLYETIPRLIEQIKSSFFPEVQEAAVVELNRIISQGMVDGTRAVASADGIFPLVKLIEERNERTAEAAMSILYNLSMDIENHSAIIAAGAVPTLRKIVLSQKPQWRRALHLLRTLPT